MTEEQLAIIEDMASHFMNPHEIAIMIGVPYDDFIMTLSDQLSVEYLTYNKAKISSTLEIRRKVVKMAKSGSPQAEMLVTAFINEQKIKEEF